MARPIMNLDEVEFADIEENGYYTSKRAQFSDHIGAHKLGYNLTVSRREGAVPVPLASRRGRDVPHPRWRRRTSLRQTNVPIRKRRDRLSYRRAEVAHQIINTGTTTLRYLALSNLAELETCAYPDSNKV